MGNYVFLKLGKMRKEQDFLVMDVNGKNQFIIQSDNKTGIFDKTTGKGKMNFKGCYFYHLSFGALPLTLTPEQLNACLQEMTVKGDTIGMLGNSVVTYGGVTVI
ncbi:MAG TPA: hypothetical protein VIK86_07895 [Candidatus Paceibacterota bacterium]